MSLTAAGAHQGNESCARPTRLRVGTKNGFIQMSAMAASALEARPPMTARKARSACARSVGIVSADDAVDGDVIVTTPHTHSNGTPIAPANQCTMMRRGNPIVMAPKQINQTSIHITILLHHHLFIA